MLRLSRLTTLESLIIDHLSAAAGGLAGGLAGGSGALSPIVLTGGGAKERSTPLSKSRSFFPVAPKAIVALDMRSGGAPSARRSELSEPIGPSSSEPPLGAAAAGELLPKRESPKGSALAVEPREGAKGSAPAVEAGEGFAGAGALPNKLRHGRGGRLQEERER